VQTNVLFIANGRNNSISDQLASRILIIKLSEGKSTYKRNAVQDAIENRDEIISACLDIIEAGLSVNTPIHGTRFKQWDRYITAPLAHATGIDITEIFAKNEDASEERDSCRLVLHGLFKYNTASKAGELAAAFNEVEEKQSLGQFKDDESWDKLFHEGLSGLLDGTHGGKVTLNDRKIVKLLNPLLNRTLLIDDDLRGQIRVKLIRNPRRCYQIQEIR
jgi:hypothetical protein